MELSEVRICLEDIQKVKSKSQALLEIVPQRTRDRPKEGFMLQHILHVLVGEAQVKKTHRPFNLLLDLLLVKVLYVPVQVLNAHF